MHGEHIPVSYLALGPHLPSQGLFKKLSVGGLITITEVLRLNQTLAHHTLTMEIRIPDIKFNLVDQITFLFFEVLSMFCAKPSPISRWSFMTCRHHLLL